MKVYPLCRKSITSQPQGLADQDSISSKIKHTADSTKKDGLQLNSLVFLGILNHLLDFVLRQARRIVGDSDLLRGARRLVDGRHVEDAIGVEVEAHFDLWDATRRWGNAGEFELAEQVVVFCSTLRSAQKASN